MKIIAGCTKFARIVTLVGLLALTAQVQAQTDPLPSWNSGAAKQAILTFVKDTTTAGGSKFVDPGARIATFDQDGTTKVPQGVRVNDKTGKPIGIHLMIGRRPVAALGNSDGDRQMLEYTQAGDGARLMMLVHHNDAVREYAYGPESKIGTF